MQGRGGGGDREVTWEQRGCEVYRRWEKRGKKVPADKATSKDWIGWKWGRGRELPRSKWGGMSMGGGKREGRKWIPIMAGTRINKKKIYNGV